jgi:hypothetical protein
MEGVQKKVKTWMHNNISILHEYYRGYLTKAIKM